MQWTLLLYFAAVDRELPPLQYIPSVLSSVTVMMILRVYAMWNRSKMILGILLCIYVPQTITGFIFAGIYSNPNTYFSGTSGNPLDMSNLEHMP